MYFEKTFNTDIELETPPMTPSFGETMFSEFGFDAELLSFNFALQDLADGLIISSVFPSEVLRDDCMWGESDFKFSNSLDSRHSRSLLVTPINFALNPSPFPTNDDPCCDTSNEYSILTPVDTESEDEVDVVGISDGSVLCGNEDNSLERNSSFLPPFDNICSQTSNNTESCFATSFFAEHFLFDKRKDLTLKRMKTSRSKAKRFNNCYSSDDNSNGSLSPRPLENRKTHNHLERKRRDELKRKFDDLRKSLPELELHEKAPKVIILTKGIDHIKQLENEDKKLTIQKNLLKSINSMLSKKLKMLTRQEEMKFRF
ncbi:myc proto-oncogene protein [Hydra vulgaris]|uniref:Myc proto-oncogene protein n=1 Tax=Hydra vulgaris TaxID=6087 RepID=D0EM49_HYDVU|nr:myc proto-oncogene protein [Hydra vulgaris]ACX32068.1 Myc1 [Hydra vulgaris]